MTILSYRCSRCYDQRRVTLPVVRDEEDDILGVPQGFAYYVCGRCMHAHVVGNDGSKRDLNADEVRRFQEHHGLEAILKEAEALAKRWNICWG